MSLYIIKTKKENILFRIDHVDVHVHINTNISDSGSLNINKQYNMLYFGPFLYKSVIKVLPSQLSRSLRGQMRFVCVSLVEVTPSRPITGQQPPQPPEVRRRTKLLSADLLFRWPTYTFHQRVSELQISCCQGKRKSRSCVEVSGGAKHPQILFHYLCFLFQTAG